MQKYLFDSVKVYPRRALLFFIGFLSSDFDKNLGASSAGEFDIKKGK
jgi:hypothetical protein